MINTVIWEFGGICLMLVKAAIGRFCMQERLVKGLGWMKLARIY